jgi:pectate lyase
MPDEWEKKFNLQPDDPSDAVKDNDEDGYTNIEEWLNGTDPTKYIDYQKPENNKNTL